MLFLTEQPFMTQKKFRAFQVRMCIGLMIWVGILVFGMYFWKSLQWYYKALVGMVAFLLAPSLGNIKDSFKSYDQYKKEWGEADKKKNQTGVTV